MALTHLVDSSVLTRLRHPAIRAVIEPALQNAYLARADITDLEVGFSARNAAEWDRLMAALAAFVLVDTTPDHFRRARQVQRLLADRGLRGGKVPELLVAAAAEERNLTVLHYDVDFDHIASVTQQGCEWVAPEGSIS